MKNKIKHLKIILTVFTCSVFVLATIFSSVAHATLSSDGVKYYLPGCVRDNKNDTTYTFRFTVRQYLESGDTKTVFEAHRDVDKSSISEGEKVIDSCGRWGAKYLDGATNTHQYNATQAQESINSVLDYGGWTVILDETGSSGVEVEYPQYYMTCGVFANESAKKHRVMVYVRKKTDANTSTDIFHAYGPTVADQGGNIMVSCAGYGITVDSEPHTEEEAMAFIARIKNDPTTWTVDTDLTTGDQSDPNKFFVQCGYFPDLGGIEVESTHVTLYQGDVKTMTYDYIYGSDLDPNKVVGARDCVRWLTVGQTYSNSAGMLLSSIPREEISQAKYDEIMAKLEAAKEADKKAYEAWQQNQQSAGAQRMDTCSSAGGAQSLGWIACPILNWLGNAAEDLYNDGVKPMLQVDPKLFNSSGTNNTKEGWEKFRDIANVLFIIFFLVVIFSQLTGYGIDNYGIKKAMPKIIVAAIMINLSYFICQALIDLSNIFGNALQSMFDALGNGLTVNINITNGAGATSSSNVSGAMVTVTILLTLVTTALLIWQNPALLLGLLVSALGVVVSIFFLFVTLGAREAAIVVLTVLSPLAVICFMLPNTKSLFDKWWKFFTSLLLVYPICGVLVGGGNYVSKLLLSSGVTNDNFWMAFVAMIIGIVPIFFIPTVLRNSLSMAGNIGAKIAGVGKGIGGGMQRGIRNSERYKNAQKMGLERQTRKRAGVNKDGSLTAIGRGKTRLAQTRLGKVVGADKAQAARYAAAKKNIQAGEEANASLTGALAEAGIVSDANREAIDGTGAAGAAFLGKDFAPGTEGAYYGREFLKAANAGNITDMNAMIEAMRASGMKSKNIAKLMRHAQNSGQLKMDGAAKAAWLRGISKKYGNDFLSTDMELQTWAQTGGLDATGAAANLGAYGDYARTSGMIKMDDIKPEDLGKLSGDSLAGMLRSGLVDSSMAQRAIAENKNLTVDKRIMLSTVANNGSFSGLSSDQIKAQVDTVMSGSGGTIGGITVDHNMYEQWTASAPQAVNVVQNDQLGQRQQNPVWVTEDPSVLQIHGNNSGGPTPTPPTPTPPTPTPPNPPSP